ncbi:MAG: glutathione peroxidase [Bacteroidota bacterium]|nr:glutathione peroxidase [Bacteroidota bacterium]
MDNINNIIVLDMDKKEINLDVYKGKVLLIVNVASKCGYTKQYAGLQQLYDKYKERGFEILAFPCNDFGGQEPGSNEEILEFCTTRFDVKFKLFDKISVLGNNKIPLYKILTDNPVTGTSDVKWNFEKFLIDKSGRIVNRYRSNIEPMSAEITSAVEKELNMQ